MVTWVALEPLSVTVEAGGEADASLRIRNTSDIVEEYRVDVVGDPALWCTAEPATLRLYPGTTGTVRLTFAPPRTPDAAAGPHPYGVKVRPVETPDAVTVPEGSVSVVPFTDVRAELLPVIVRGWRRARPRLVVDNFGNTTVTAAVRAGVQDQSVDFDTRTPSFQVPPGRAHFGVLTGRPSRLLWFGQKVRHPFTTTVVPSGSEPVSVSGTYMQTALLPSWLARLFAVLATLLAAFLAVWFLVKPSVTSHATAEAAASASPVSQAQTSAPAPSASTTPSHPPDGGAAQAPPPPAPKQTVPPSVTLPDPAGWWKLNDGVNSPAASAADSSGTHPMSGTGVEWCSGRGCAYFDGKGSYMETATAVLPMGPGHSFTVSASVNLLDIPANQAFATAVSQDGNGQSTFFLQYDGLTGDWDFTMQNATRAVGNTKAITGVWTNLIGVYNASTGQEQLYVDGTLQATATNTSPSSDSGPTVIGRAQYNGAQSDFWPGSIKDVRVFDQALNGQQVTLLAQQAAKVP